MSDEFFPHIVVGSGPGGATTAHLLSQHGKEVLLLEEGSHYPGLESFSPQEMLHKYRNGGITATVGKPIVQYVEGRTLGGGSEINSGLYHRTPRSILNQWEAEYGLLETDWDGLCSQIENDLSVGPMTIPLSTASLKLAQGAESLGWQATEVPRWHKYEKTGPGERQTMTRTYLKRAQDTGRCKVETGQRVVGLTPVSGGWQVTTSNGRKLKTSHLFLCCGAVYTPFLLKNNGITQNIGDTLSLHPTVKVTALFPEEVNSREMGVPVHQVKEFAPAMSFGCSISQPGHLALAGLDQPELLRRVRTDWKRMAIYYVNVLGTSHGKIRTVPGSSDPAVSYTVTLRELRELAIGLKRLCRLLLETGAQALFPSITGQRPITRLAELDNLSPVLPRQTARLMTVHLFGSCRSGEAPHCPVDSFGNLKGHPGLHIHDASLLCTAPGVNPQGTIMTLAYRNTLRFLEEQG